MAPTTADSNYCRVNFAPTTAISLLPRNLLLFYTPHDYSRKCDTMHVVTSSVTHECVSANDNTLLLTYVPAVVLLSPFVTACWFAAA
jgi:hypothetical protein